MLFDNKITGSDKNAFIQKVKSVSYMLGIQPDWLMAVMNHESTFRAAIKNKISGATGLIQFMPNTAKWLGTSVEALANMSRVAQLDYVLKYYQKWQKNGIAARNLTDLALITFYPVAKGKPDSYVIGSEVSPTRAATIGKQNPGINGGKPISILNYKNWVASMLPKNLDQKTINAIVGIKPVVKVAGAILISLGLVAAGRFIYVNHKNRK